MLRRPRHLSLLQERFRTFPVMGILGARQVGKTTLARQLADLWQGAVAWFDCEDPRVVAQLANPMAVLEPLRGLVVLDEVQRRPELFPVLRVLVDRPDVSTRFLVLGSASIDYLAQSSESLAGRIGYLDLTGFELADVGATEWRRLWLRGGFPRSFLAIDDAASAVWREDFLRTFVQRDLPQLGVQVPAATMRRFWNMLAHYHGQTWNASELARAFGTSSKSVDRYVDHLVGGLVVTRLQPWHENIGKRQVRSPKVYIRDSGILHALLGLAGEVDLQRHPKVGASFEGFVLEQVMARLDPGRQQSWYWATYAGAELDLLLLRGGRIGFEVKHTETPTVTRSMHAAMDSLGLDQLVVVHVGQESFALADRVRAVAAGDLLAELERLE